MIIRIRPPYDVEMKLSQRLVMMSLVPALVSLNRQGQFDVAVRASNTAQVPKVELIGETLRETVVHELS